MLRKNLTDIDSTLEKAHKELPLACIEQLRAEIKSDLKSLSSKKTRILDTRDGYIDYYSPQVKAQLAYKKERLDYYRDRLIEAQAIAILIGRTQAQLDTLKAETSPSEEQQREIKHLQKTLDTLTHSKSLNTLVKRKDVSRICTELAPPPSPSHTESGPPPRPRSPAPPPPGLETVAAPEPKETPSDELTSELGLEVLSKGIKNVNKKLTKHQKRMDTLPRGMLDVKRALMMQQQKLNYQRQCERLQEELSTSPSESEKLEIEEQITLLTEKMSELTFSESAEEEEEIITRLLELQTMMKAIGADYQAIATSGIDVRHLIFHASEHYCQDLMLFQIALSAFNDYLKEAQQLSSSGSFVAECILRANKYLPAKERIYANVKEFRQIKTRVNPAYELANMKRLHYFSGTAPMLITDVVTKQKGRIFHIPLNDEQYALDFPVTDYAGALGNCRGASMMFLKKISDTNPAINNLCPEIDLLNMQLDQDRPLSSKHGVEVLATHKSKRSKKGLEFKDIEDALSSPVDAEYGELCLLKFGGATRSDSESDIGHGVALIKLKEPNPYQYVFFEPGMGAFGCTSIEPLKQYLNMLFGRLKFNSFKLEKYGEVNKTTLDFIQGIPAIAPDTEDYVIDEQPIESIDRLLPLAKYASLDPKEAMLLLFERVILLDPEEQKRLYSALMDNHNFSQVDLLALAIEHNHTDFLVTNSEASSFEDYNTNLIANTSLNKEQLTSLVNAYIAKGMDSELNALYENKKYRKVVDTIQLNLAIQRYARSRNEEELILMNQLIKKPLDVSMMKDSIRIAMDLHLEHCLEIISTHTEINQRINQVNILYKAFETIKTNYPFEFTMERGLLTMSVASDKRAFYKYKNDDPLRNYKKQIETCFTDFNIPEDLKTRILNTSEIAVYNIVVFEKELVELGEEFIAALIKSGLDSQAKISEKVSWENWVELYRRNNPEFEVIKEDKERQHLVVRNTDSDNIIKIMSFSVDDDVQRQRCEKNQLLFRRLNEDKTYDFELNDSIVSIDMDNLGVPLRDIIHSVTNEQLERIYTQIANHMKTLHEMGYVHGDICLDNFVYNDDTGTIHLIDFETATMLEEGMAKLHEFNGVLFEEAGIQADQYTPDDDFKLFKKMSNDIRFLIELKIHDVKNRLEKAILNANEHSEDIDIGNLLGQFMNDIPRVLDEEECSSLLHQVLDSANSCVDPAVTTSLRDATSRMRSPANDGKDPSLASKSTKEIEASTPEPSDERGFDEDAMYKMLFGGGEPEPEPKPDSMKEVMAKLKDIFTKQKIDVNSAEGAGIIAENTAGFSTEQQKEIIGTLHNVLIESESLKTSVEGRESMKAVNDDTLEQKKFTGLGKGS